MTAVNEGLRWTLILGCLLLTALEAPESSLVLVQDLQGPWRAERTQRPPDARAALNPGAAGASVAPEDDLGLDRDLSSRLAAHRIPAPGVR